MPKLTKRAICLALLLKTQPSVFVLLFVIIDLYCFRNKFLETSSEDLPLSLSVTKEEYLRY